MQHMFVHSFILDGSIHDTSVLKYSRKGSQEQVDQDILIMGLIVP